MGVIKKIKRDGRLENHHVWEGKKGVTLIGWSKMTSLRTDPNAEKVSVQETLWPAKLQSRVSSKYKGPEAGRNLGPGNHQGSECPWGPVSKETTLQMGLVRWAGHGEGLSRWGVSCQTYIF